MEADFVNHLGEILELEIESVSPVSGGDINEASVLSSKQHKVFVKWNSNSIALQMLQCESNALKHLAQANAINIPDILACGKFEDKSYLALEYVDEKNVNTAVDQRDFGIRLANLHNTSAPFFGWETDNFIGTLKQNNTKHTDWPEYYINHRIESQIEIAKSQNHLQRISLTVINKFYKELTGLLRDVKPALLHGDLWSGNFIIDTKGNPYLIDPASYYGDREVDLAMTELFGGFDSSFYEGYQEAHALSDFYHDKKELYQLYYLVVHLNLFGKSYESACERILKQFS